MSRILVIEDDDPLRRILMLNLARRGYTVAEADSVASACEMLASAEASQVPFDLLLLDLNLPDATGWDVLRNLTAQSPSQQSAQSPPQVIILSAVRPARSRLDEFHPAGVLIKPFPLDALSQLIARVLAPRTSGVSPTSDDDGDAAQVAW